MDCLVPRRLSTFNTIKRVAHRKTLHEVFRRQAMPESIVGRARTRLIIPCARHPDFSIAPGYEAGGWRFYFFLLFITLLLCKATGIKKNFIDLILLGSKYYLKYK